MTNTEVKIRFAAPTDAATLADICERSFHAAFASDERNRPEDMRAYMDENFTVQAVADDLTTSGATYLIAEIGERAVGYAKLHVGAAEDCIEAKRPIELCRLYSLDEFIGKGVGKALMLRSLEIARENDCDVFWLGVWEFNFRAQKFYARFGFEKCGEHVFLLGSDPQTDWILQKKL